MIQAILIAIIVALTGPHSASAEDAPLDDPTKLTWSVYNGGSAVAVKQPSIVEVASDGVRVESALGTASCHNDGETWSGWVSFYGETVPCTDVYLPGNGYLHITGGDPPGAPFIEVHGWYANGPA